MTMPRFVKQSLVAMCTIALMACASKVRLDDLPPVDSQDTSTRSNTGIVTGAGTTTSTPVSNTTGNPSSNASGSGTSTAITTVQAASSTSAQPQSGLLAQRSVYFDYDSYVIREEAKTMLNAHAQHLSNNLGLRVALEGHTDERGGREYNLALGQKRANAVQQALQLLGVSTAQMEASSFGKEKPKALGSAESDYAENRRVDIQYK